MQGSCQLEEITSGCTFLLQAIPSLAPFRRLGPSGCQRGRCGGAPRSVGGGKCRARTPLVTSPWPRCPPPAGFADGPERAGFLRVPCPGPRNFPVQRLLLQLQLQPGARPAGSRAPGRVRSPGCSPRSASAGYARRGAEPEVRPPPGTLRAARPGLSPLSAPQEESEETGRDRLWQKFVYSGGLQE